MRIAVDIGFGFIKAMNEEGKKVIFPSIMTKRSENSLRGIVGGDGDDYSIIYWEDGLDNRENEKKLFIGDAGMTSGGTRKWEDKEQFNVEELKIFIATAVGLVNTKNEEVDVCVGLPMSYYLQKRNELISILENINANVSFTGPFGIKNIKFKSVFCFPQGAGAYYASIFNRNGEIKNFDLATVSVGVIDIGYRTTDFLVMGKGRKGIVIKDTLSGSLEEEGMNKAFQDIERMISDKIGKHVGLLEIEKSILWFGGKFAYKKEEIFLREYEEQAYRDLGERIASMLKLKWSDEVDLLSTIIITGGGGESLYPVLKTKFEQAELQDDSSFANCEGYLGAQARKIVKDI